MRLHDCGIQEGSEVGLAVKGNGGGRLEGFFAAGSAGWSSEEHLPAAAFYTTAQDARFRERPSSIVRSLDIDLEQLKEANKGWYTDFERCVADDRELHHPVTLTHSLLGTVEPTVSCMAAPRGVLVSKGTAEQ